MVDPVEKARLRKLLSRWVNTKREGAIALNDSYKNIKDSKAQWKFLQKEVASRELDRGRPPARANEEWKPSRGDKVRDRIVIEELRCKVVSKMYKIGSPDASRMLKLYGHIRCLGQESAAPIPKLLDVQTDSDNGWITMKFEYVGQDHDVNARGCGASEFKRLKAEATKTLVDLGVDESSVPKLAKNWVLLPSGNLVQKYRAIAVDTGNCRLKAGVKRRMQ